MITEKIIYITEDLIRFDNKCNAESHEEIYSRLSYDEQKWLGTPLEYPGIGGGYCLETRQHKQFDLIQVTMDIINLLNTYGICNHKNYNPDTFLNPCLKMISDIQSSADENENSTNWNKLTNTITKYVSYYYYENEPSYVNNMLEKCILKHVVQRLNNTSWKSGIEYPESNWSRPWRLRENEWEDFVMNEKKYIADGGKYR